MLSKNPLDIPEIMGIVALHLEKSDLARCLCVSKNWKGMFLPHRWSRISRKFEEQGTFHYHYGPDQEVLHKHCHLVQDLTIYGPFEGDHMLIYPNLRTLRIDFYMYSPTDDWFNNFKRTIEWDLFEKAPLLQDLSLDYLIVESQLCQRLSGHPNLRRLSLWDAYIGSNVVLEFLEACKNLESLCLKNVSFESEIPSLPQDAVFGRMRRLSLQGQSVNWSYVAMVFDCPMLESFEWDNYNFEARISIDHPVQKCRWSEIVSTNESNDYQSSEWASLLRGIGNCLGDITFFKLKKMACATFGPQAFEALLSHSSTLVELDLQRTPSETSAMIGNVLYSCPKLEILHAGCVLASDITQGGQWVCQQLRELSIRIGVGETEQHLHHLVFERLSTLVRLESLDICRYWRHGSAESHLHFRLDCGLGQLVGLQELTFLGFARNDIQPTQMLRLEDVEWMMDSWKKLKKVQGCLNSDQEIDRQLKNMMKSHGIST